MERELGVTGAEWLIPFGKWISCASKAGQVTRPGLLLFFFFIFIFVFVFVLDRRIWHEPDMEEFGHDYRINYFDSLHSHSTWLIGLLNNVLDPFYTLYSLCFCPSNMLSIVTCMCQLCYLYIYIYIYSFQPSIIQHCRVPNPCWTTLLVSLKSEPSLALSVSVRMKPNSPRIDGSSYCSWPSSRQKTFCHCKDSMKQPFYLLGSDQLLSTQWGRKQRQQYIIVMSVPPRHSRKRKHCKRV